MQAETLNMMTKYQCFFARIESSFNNILNSNRLREMRMRQKAFEKFRQNASQVNQKVHINSQIIYMRLKSNLGVKILDKYAKSRQKALKRAFEDWRIKSEAMRAIKRLNDYLQAEKELKNQENKQIIASLN